MPRHLANNLLYLEKSSLPSLIACDTPSMTRCLIAVLRLKVFRSTCWRERGSPGFFCLISTLMIKLRSNVTLFLLDAALLRVNAKSTDANFLNSFSLLCF